MEPVQQTVIPIAGPPPPPVSPAAASALIQSNQRLEAELATARAQLVRSAEVDQASRKSAAIAAALADVPLIPGTASQLTTLLEKEISLHTDPTTGQLVPVGPGLKAATEHIHTQLGRPEFAHFIRAQNQGGTAGGNGAQHAPTGPAWEAAKPPPRNLTEAFLQHVEGSHNHRNRNVR
jgi:hypothetical protein